MNQHWGLGLIVQLIYHKNDISDIDDGSSDVNASPMIKSVSRFKFLVSCSCAHVC